MQDNVRGFGLDLGHKVLARDWIGVHGLLAPWLQQSIGVDAVSGFFEDEYRRTLKDNGVEEIHYPQYPDPELGGNDHANATALRAPMSFKPGCIRPVAPEVTDTNFRYWLMMRLQCSDEQMAQLDFDHFAEVWMAVVDSGDGLRVGYWSHGAYRVASSRRDRRLTVST
jgi:hypothetical protein